MSTGPHRMKGGAESWLELKPTGKRRSVLIGPYRTVLQSREERVKSETFSDQWHVRVYSHAARSSSRSSPFKEDRLTTGDSSQRSRRIGHLSRVFPPRDVLSSLKARAARGEGIGLVINSSQRSAFILRMVEVKTKMNTNRKSLL